MPRTSAAVRLRGGGGGVVAAGLSGSVVDLGVRRVRPPASAGAGLAGGAKEGS